MLWVVNIIAYVINAVVTGGSQQGWFGRTNDEISDDYPTLITPIGWAFSIWGLIFLGELIFVIWGALPANRDERVLKEGVGCWFAIACVVQAAWSIVFAQELLIVSAVLLALIAFSLGMAVICLSPFKLAEDRLFCSITYWAVHFPIGLHGGWTLAAGFVNVNVALEMDEVSSEVTALILSIVGAAFVSSIVAVVFYDQAYMAAVVWAIAGIAAKQAYRRERLGKPVADGVDDALQGLWIALILVGVMGIFATVRARNKNFAENEEDKRYSVRASGADNSRTPALFSS